MTTTSTLLDAPLRCEDAAEPDGSIPDPTHEYDGCASCKAKRKRAAELFSPSRRANRSKQQTDVLAGLERLAVSGLDSPTGEWEQPVEHEHHEELAVPDWLGGSLVVEPRHFHSHDHA